jgi:hypothetical protein
MKNHTIRDILRNSIRSAVAIEEKLDSGEIVNLKVIDTQNRTGDRIMRAITTALAAHKLSGEAFSMDQEI